MLVACAWRANASLVRGAPVASRRPLVACLLLLVGAGALSGCLTGRAGTPRQVGRRATATAWFTEEAELRGLRVATQFEGTRPMNILQSAGAGVALLHHDSDGWLDVFVVGRKGFNPQGHGFLFRNRGDGTFED